MATPKRRRRTRAEQRAWADGYSTGYKSAHDLLQAELRAQYGARHIPFITWLLTGLHTRRRPHAH